MAKVRGGDITQLLINGRAFEVKADSNVTYRLSGRTNESEPTGSGGVHTTQRLKLGGFDSCPVSIDSDKQDLEFLQDFADSGEPGPCSMTLINGKTYSGDLTIEGEVDASSGDGQVEISALGAVFEQI
jgi:hypothetical protein